MRLCCLCAAFDAAQLPVLHDAMSEPSNGQKQRAWEAREHAVDTFDKDWTRTVWRSACHSRPKRELHDLES